MLARPGTLVHARGREWVVLPESTEAVLMVRPVGGLDEEVVGILPAVEPVRSATFALYQTYIEVIRFHAVPARKAPKKAGPIRTRVFGMTT